MNKKLTIVGALAATVFVLVQCSDSNKNISEKYPAIKAAFGNRINPDNLANYGNQLIPSYINKDNTNGNTITDAKATLGRVLFYDKQLSIDNTVSCASCHHQAFAFSDTALASRGVSGGLTGRHSMRLVNARFGGETKFFWDERAASLEQQTTQPIKDHSEMGFSGQNGRPDFAAMLSKLGTIAYYKELFQLVYGDVAITEARLQECLAQFIRSIQSFDTKYDAGRAQVATDNQDFPNFSTQENSGKTLFLNPPTFDATGNRIAGGLGCNRCHRAPEFDIHPNAGNNGVIGRINAPGFDLTNTKAPTLRNLLNANGQPHTAMMHMANFTLLQDVLSHYNLISAGPTNPSLDSRLRPNGYGQKLHLTPQEEADLIAFLKTLTGTQVYTDARWSNPFQ